MLVDIITGTVKFKGRPSTLVYRIQELLKLNWQVHFYHTWRDENRSVDWLTNFSFSLNSFQIHIMETPPNRISDPHFLFRNLHVQECSCKLIILFLFSLWHSLYQKKSRKGYHGIISLQMFETNSIAKKKLMKMNHNLVINIAN